MPDATATTIDFAAERKRMVETQIVGRGIADPRVVVAMETVPREAFVPAALAEFAYEDTPLPIGHGQTISQPAIVAEMLELAEIGPEARVLEIGTGSGYGAAVLSRIAAQVYTMDCNAALVEEAKQRFARLGYWNIEARQGDGTLGWPDAAPFDAIIVTAGGPEVPDALRRQLDLFGMLVVPVGPDLGRQTLRRVIRSGEESWEEDAFGPVAFVPLIGEQGWKSRWEAEAGHAPAAPAAPAPAPAPAPIPVARRRAPPAPLPDPVGLMREAAEPLPDLDDPAFGPLFDRLGAAKVVLLGEATHGTAEFYRARARITERLIREHGFTIVAVEADWPDARRIDRYVRHRAVPKSEEEAAFTRFPVWMWRNTEVERFVEWLRRHNAGIAEPGRRAAFYGLDLYSLHSSIRSVLAYLGKVDPEAARTARERYGCLTPWQRDPATYGRAALSAGFGLCEREVLATLRDLLDKRLDYLRRDGESFLDAAQNARLVAAAEKYYRAMYYGSRESWNLRDRHMFETLETVLAAHGPEARAVVWAHNSHIGDARATEMGVMRAELNIGQLCRERFGDSAFLVGFGTDRGTVAAASDWDGPMEVKAVRPSHPDSYERLSRDTGIARFLLDLRPDGRQALRQALAEPPRLERAIGVIYRPETELLSHYFDACLPRQFDAWVWFEQTRAVTPLPARRRTGGVPETYPFAL